MSDSPLPSRTQPLAVVVISRAVYISAYTCVFSARSRSRSAMTARAFTSKTQCDTNASTYAIGDARCRRFPYERDNTSYTKPAAGYSRCRPPLFAFAVSVARRHRAPPSSSAGASDAHRSSASRREASTLLCIQEDTPLSAHAAINGLPRCVIDAIGGLALYIAFVWESPAQI